MKQRIAQRYERLAIELEMHIKFYIPNCWTKPIHDFQGTPMFSDIEARTFMEAHKINNLTERLEELAKNNEFPYSQIKPWYVKEAIKDFFAKELYLS